MEQNKAGLLCGGITTILLFRFIAVQVVPLIVGSVQRELRWHFWTKINILNKILTILTERIIYSWPSVPQFVLEFFKWKLISKVHFAVYRTDLNNPVCILFQNNTKPFLGSFIFGRHLFDSLIVAKNVNSYFWGFLWACIILLWVRIFQDFLLMKTLSFIYLNYPEWRRGQISQ